MRPIEQAAHRARWQERHKALEIKQPREPEPRPDPTFLIRCRTRVDIFLMLTRKRGLLRHLSWLWWTEVLRAFHLGWNAGMWLRGAYQYARWRLSPLDDMLSVIVKAEACEACEWRTVVSEGPSAGVYCTACICPQVPRASLVRKNLRTYPHCPKGKHPGSKIDPYARMRPCMGCGSKRNGKQ